MPFLAGIIWVDEYEPKELLVVVEDAYLELEVNLTKLINAC
ncbi:MAG: hypothetical protein ACTS73_01990 [Arsenophonus sp. NEOnobi-MAG3]